MEPYHQWVLVLCLARVVALSTQVIVRALWASEAMASLDLQATQVADACKGRGIRVVQVVQHHGTAVLGSPDGVKLVVVALAQRQEGLQAARQAERYYRAELH